MPGIAEANSSAAAHDEPTDNTSQPPTSDNTPHAFNDHPETPAAPAPDMTAPQNDSPPTPPPPPAEIGAPPAISDYQAPMGPREITQTDRLNKQLLQSLLQRMQSTESGAATSSSSEDDETDWS